MTKRDNTEISMTEYNDLTLKLDANISAVELMKIHKYLIGKTCKSQYFEINDCGEDFVKKILLRDYGRPFVYHYPAGAKEFIRSQYLSEYFKNNMRIYLDSLYFQDILNTDESINDMTKEKLEIISYYLNTNLESDILKYFQLYLFKLDGDGPRDYIKNNISNKEIASYILMTSGLNDIENYINIVGANFIDFNEQNLLIIFKKLLKLDYNYAINFIDLVNKTNLFSITEFIENFLNFANNNFKIITFSKTNIQQNNSKESLHLSLISLYSNYDYSINSDDYSIVQIKNSMKIKKSFNSLVDAVIQSLTLNDKERISLLAEQQIKKYYRKNL